MEGAGVAGGDRETVKNSPPLSIPDEETSGPAIKGEEYRECHGD
jgi:hypothetical protein